MQPLEPTENKSKSSKSAKPRHFLHSRTMALIVACLAILPILIGAYLIYVVARYQASPSNLSDQFGSTTFDLNNLSPAKPTAATGLVVINGNEQVNGNLTVAGS
ncbi:hypothetical protein HYX70_03800, partial [Candidatus Saccharibacteria bacterium]|nr:hypothetical protein [Candidatus Saccharibacteria bacterium]